MDDGIDWQDAFQCGSYIAGGSAYPDRWVAEAQAFRDLTNNEIGVAYGDAPRETVDFFWPRQSPKGLAVFVHGGYWHRFDPASWSHFAQGALALGWAVALPGYTLAPDARVSRITHQVARAIDMASGRVAGPIRLAGHSAGGHLVCRMVCADTPLSTATITRVARVVSISGVHDLRPIRLHSMNDILGMDQDEAIAESPALLQPLPDVSVSAWVGARERPEFLRQAALLSEAWTTDTRAVPLLVEPERHHFDVIDGLRDPAHPLAQSFVGD
ncbi:MAG: alpha/beta hydrolase [Paracoccaceae bacterium]